MPFSQKVRPDNKENVSTLHKEAVFFWISFSKTPIIEISSCLVHPTAVSIARCGPLREPIKMLCFFVMEQFSLIIIDFNEQPWFCVYVNHYFAVSSDSKANDQNEFL